MMSDDFLRIIPYDPWCIPAVELRQAAVATLRRFVPDADTVEAIVSDTVQFIDPGGNFERVMCPRCQTEITDWCSDAMHEAYASAFADLSVTLPCCETRISLNDLEYDWPAGFARFVLEARSANNGGRLPSDQLAELQRLLECQLKQVLAHY